MRVSSIFVPHPSIYSRLETENRQYGQRPKSGYSGRLYPIGFIYDRMYFLYHERQLIIPFLEKTNIFNVCSFAMDQPNSWSTVFTNSIVFQSNFIHVPTIGLSNDHILALYGDGDTLFLTKINRETNARAHYHCNYFSVDMVMTHAQLIEKKNKWFGISYQCNQDPDKHQMREKLDCCVWKLCFNEEKMTFSFEFLASPNSILRSFFTVNNKYNFSKCYFHLELVWHNEKLMIGQRLFDQNLYEIILLDQQSGEIEIYKTLYDFLGTNLFPSAVRLYRGELCMVAVKWRKESNSHLLRINFLRLKFYENQKVSTLEPWFEIPKIFFVSPVNTYLFVTISNVFDYIVVLHNRGSIQLDHYKLFHLAYIVSGSPGHREPASLQQLCKRIVFSKNNYESDDIDNEMFHNLLSQISGHRI